MVQEIDGQALMLLQADHLMSAMSIKLGPALKICEQVDINLQTCDVPIPNEKYFRWTSWRTTWPRTDGRRRSWESRALWRDPPRWKGHKMLPESKKTLQTTTTTTTMAKSRTLSLACQWKGWCSGLEPRWWGRQDWPRTLMMRRRSRDWWWTWRGRRWWGGGEEEAAACHKVQQGETWNVCLDVTYNSTTALDCF